MTRDVLDLTCELIRRASITPDDAGCQALLSARLAPLGFVGETIAKGGVTNWYARRGDRGPLLCLAGHTDVVPSGPAEAWTHPPFTPTLDHNTLYGRGAADMKGSIAAMVVATERFVAAYPQHAGSIAFLITSDEEGPAEYGTREVMRVLDQRGERIDHCLIGEPSSSTELGDVIRVGRRGSLHAEFTLRGLQGHVAYPDKARNPIHEAGPLIARLAAEVWDRGNAQFPPTTFQISNIHGGTGATNVIPGSVTFQGNFRYSTAVTAEQLRTRCAALIEELGIDAEIQWTLSGEPFLSAPGALTQAVCASIRTLQGIDTECSTGGGTSDGRFIAPYGTEVIELGPVNASIHQIDEHVDVRQLEQLAKLYEDIMRRVLVEQATV